MSALEDWIAKWPKLSKVWGDNPEILKYPPELKTTPWTSYGSYHSRNISINSAYGGSMMDFTLMYYPSCCASLIMHKFTINPDFFTDMDELTAILDEIFHAEVRSKDSAWLRNRRIIGVFVERGRIGEIQARRANGEDMRLVDIEPFKNPKIDHHQFRDYFMKQPRYTERLFVNENTDYIMHEFEVVLPR